MSPRTCLACREVGLWELKSTEKRLSYSLTKYARDKKHPDEVKSSSPNDRFLIALLSPAQNRETEPPVCQAKKVKAVDAREQWSDIFSSPVYGQKIADWRPFPEDFRKCEVDFSAPQTAWRREGFEPSVQFCHANPRRVRMLQIAKP
jgi:hypothetical protein